MLMPSQRLAFRASNELYHLTKARVLPGLLNRDGRYVCAPRHTAALQYTAILTPAWLADAKVAFFPNYKHFGPRFGFAFRVTDKFVVRSGYGIIYNSFQAIKFGFDDVWRGVGTSVYAGTQENAIGSPADVLIRGKENDD